MHHAQLEHIDETRGARQAEVFGRLLRAKARRLHIQALRQHGLLDPGQVLRRSRQVGQACGQRERRLHCPQAHQPRQALACGKLRTLGPHQVERGVGVKALLARLGDLVPVARLRHAPPQFGAGLGRLPYLLHVANGFTGGNRSDPGLARLAGERQHLLRRLALHARKTPAFDF